ncbi:MAG: HAD hydrolase family protein [Hungatella sp.]|jgi:YrbI family 3-deoxy-D-manno-octulosonate 8-phosphate phosphatase|nr:HAD hydrolase family protein [Hungatella sp.]
MIQLVCFDIDGVLTDGNLLIDQNGNELKSFRLTEIDALNDIKRMGLMIAAITGENTPIVDVFRRRVNWDKFVSGRKDKLSEVKQMEKQFGITYKDICYIGDGKYDIPAIKYVGLGICPKNAIAEAKAAADVILNGSGGSTCVYELYLMLKDMKDKNVSKEER